jgi:hypothetical protein
MVPQVPQHCPHEQFGWHMRMKLAPLQPQLHDVVVPGEQTPWPLHDPATH